jgi:hypothetical protein
MGKFRIFRRVSSYAVTATMAVFGVTGIASAQTISNTGPGSHNNITDNMTNNCTVTNNNRVSATNTNQQTATTGSVTEANNTNAGATWGGWSGYDPATSQANGTSYASWWSGVVNWMAEHASGSGWNSDQSNLSWTPSSSDWSAYDPLSWQASGQSFGNWYNGVESYLNTNSGPWLLSWPADATGSGYFGATSGSATNNYNANFSININNTARAAAGTDSCGHSLFTPPAGNGGAGSGGAGGAVLGASTTAPSFVGSGNGGYGGYSGTSFYAPTSHSVTSPVISNPAPVVTQPSVGLGGSAPSLPVVSPVSSISNTGPGSTNNITSNTTDNRQVSNNNCISVVNTSTQTSSTGNTTVTGNTSTGGAGSGGATNNNGTGGDIGVTN